MAGSERFTCSDTRCFLTSKRAEIISLSLHSANTGTLLRNIGSLIALSMLAGCSVGPKYRPPAVQIQPFHNALPAGTQKSAAPPLDTWWEGFQDPELTRIIQRAIDQNLDLAASLSRVEQARAAAKEAGARLKPSGTAYAQSNSFRHSLESEVGRYLCDFPGFSRNQTYPDLGVRAFLESE